MKFSDFLVLAALVTLTLLSLSCSSTTDTIVFSGSLNGYLDKCG